MTGERRETTLFDIAIPTRGTVSGPFGSSISKQFFVSNGVPVIRGNNLSLGTNGPRFRDDDFVYLTSDKADELSSAECLPGDLIFTARGTIGQVGLIPLDARFPRYILSANQLRLRSDAKIADALYLYYWFSSPKMVAVMQGRNAGSALPNMNLGALRGLPVVLPPLPEQHAIGRILGAFDDKIELNRRMNETLEAMARTLFKSWFINFDPVRAKAAGRDPVLPTDIAALFPDSFQDSDLGEIPKAWKVGRVADIGAVVCGKTPPTQIPEFYGDDVPFITIPDMHGRVFATHTQKRLSRAGAAWQQKKTIPDHVICVSCIATPGLVVITSEAAQTNQQINTVVPSRSNEAYYWFWSLRDLGEEIRSGASGGSVVSNLSTGRFSDLRVLTPAAQLRSCYHSLVTPVFSRILANAKESDTLAILRDTLLPKLLSGELHVQTDQQLWRGRDYL